MTHDAAGLGTGYEELVSAYPERCRVYGVCPRIDGCILRATRMAGMAPESFEESDTDEKLAGRIRDNNRQEAEQLGRLCLSGQNPECGIAT